MDRIKKVISEAFSVPAESVNENTVLRNLQTWDSFNHMVFIVAVELEFGVELSAEEIVKMLSVADMQEILAGKTQVV